METTIQGLGFGYWGLYWGGGVYRGNGEYDRNYYLGWRVWV